MQKLHPQEVDVPTYHIGVHNTIGISSSRLILVYTLAKGMEYSLFIIFLLHDSFTTISQMTKMKILCKSYTRGKLKYKLTTSGFKKLLVFDLLEYILGYIIFKGMVDALFTILLLDDTFPMVS